MTLGLESGIVRLVPYDPAWPGLFAAEAERLQKLFAPAGLVVTLEHTGSTAIPGLAAKPILDILGGYAEGTPVTECIDVLTAAGYVHRGEQGIPGREFSDGEIQDRIICTSPRSIAHSGGTTSLSGIVSAQTKHCVTPTPR